MRMTCDVPVAGRVYGLGRNAAYEAARTGKIPAIRIGNRLIALIGPMAEELGQPVEAVVEAIEEIEAA